VEPGQEGGPGQGAGRGQGRACEPPKPRRVEIESHASDGTEWWGPGARGRRWVLGVGFWVLGGGTQS
jgi:hypothetical protein